MDKYRIEKEGSTVTIWDDEEGLGLRFIEGKRLQKYTYEAVYTDPSVVSTEEKVNKLVEVTNRLEEYAAGIYPMEFKPLNGDE